MVEDCIDCIQSYQKGCSSSNPVYRYIDIENIDIMSPSLGLAVFARSQRHSL